MYDSGNKGHGRKMNDGNQSQLSCAVYCACSSRSSGEGWSWAESGRLAAAGIASLCGLHMLALHVALLLHTRVLVGHMHAQYSNAYQ